MPCRFLNPDLAVTVRCTFDGKVCQQMLDTERSEDQPDLYIFCEKQSKHQFEPEPCHQEE